MLKKTERDCIFRMQKFGNTGYITFYPAVTWREWFDTIELSQGPESW